MIRTTTGISLALVLTACAASAPSPKVADPSTTAASSATTPPAPPPPVAAGAPASTDDSVRAARAATIFERLKANDYEGARVDFDATMREKLSASAIEGVWKQVGSQIGALSSCALRVEKPMSGFVVRSYDCTFERGHLGSRVAFDGEQKVAGLFFLAPSAMPELSTP